MSEQASSHLSGSGELNEHASDKKRQSEEKEQQKLTIRLNWIKSKELVAHGTNELKNKIASLNPDFIYRALRSPEVWFLSDLSHANRGFDSFPRQFDVKFTKSSLSTDLPVAAAARSELPEVAVDFVLSAGEFYSSILEEIKNYSQSLQDRGWQEILEKKLDDLRKLVAEADRLGIKLKVGMSKYDHTDFGTLYTVKDIALLIPEQNTSVNQDSWGQESPGVPQGEQAVHEGWKGRLLSLFRRRRSQYLKR